MLKIRGGPDHRRSSNIDSWLARRAAPRNPARAASPIGLNVRSVAAAGTRADAHGAEAARHDVAVACAAAPAPCHTRMSDRLNGFDSRCSRSPIRCKSATPTAPRELTVSPSASPAESATRAVSDNHPSDLTARHVRPCRDRGTEDDWRSRRLLAQAHNHAEPRHARPHQYSSRSPIRSSSKR